MQTVGASAFRSTFSTAILLFSYLHSFVNVWWCIVIRGSTDAHSANNVPCHGARWAVCVINKLSTVQYCWWHCSIAPPVDRHWRISLQWPPQHLGDSHCWCNIVTSYFPRIRAANQREFSIQRNVRVSEGNWDHRLVASNCWNTDLLADLAEVKTNHCLVGPKFEHCTDAKSRTAHNENTGCLQIQPNKFPDDFQETF